MNILAAIHRWIKDIPTRIAHGCGDRSLSYQQLGLHADFLAALLSRSLPDDHSPIAVIGHKEPEMLIAFLGAVKSGHPYVPLDISLPTARVNSIVETARTSLTLTPEKVQEILAEMNGTHPALPTRQIQSEDPWYIIFTSGSTGAPEGVTITAGCLQSFLTWMLAEQKLTPQAIGYKLRILEFCQEQLFMAQNINFGSFPSGSVGMELAKMSGFLSTHLGKFHAN